MEEKRRGWLLRSTLEVLQDSASFGGNRPLNRKYQWLANVSGISSLDECSSHQFCGVLRGLGVWGESCMLYALVLVETRLQH